MPTKIKSHQTPKIKKHDIILFGFNFQILKPYPLMSVPAKFKKRRRATRGLLPLPPHSTI
jgi:hypothetical protein